MFFKNLGGWREKEKAREESWGPPRDSRPSEDREWEREKERDRDNQDRDENDRDPERERDRERETEREMVIEMTASDGQGLILWLRLWPYG